MRGFEKFTEALPNRRFVVVSNREPYEHVYDDRGGGIDVRRPAGGLTSALDPILQATEGIWIAWGSGDADFDVADEAGRVRVPPETERYTLHRVRLDQRDIEEYYLGYSNQVLWPLCHYRPALTRIRARHWARYEAVNRRFAEAAAQDIGEQPAAVWFQDYHLARAPMTMRDRARNATLAQFWHIPFPSPEIFRIATRAPLILEGLLANDLLGFHLPSYVANFLRSVHQELGLPIDFERRCVQLPTHTCWVRALPISIDIDEYRRAATVPDAQPRMRRLRERFAPNQEVLGIGVDRMDYSKGLEEKLKALDFLWDRYPEWRENFTFVQVAVPSRTDIEAYDQLSDKVERMAWSINERYRTEQWTPVHLLKESLPAERLALLYRTADICVISSLQDGMNLVAKEFVTSQVDKHGVLMLSKFAGAVEEMVGCVEINPYDPEDLADHLHETLRMPPMERITRMTQLQNSMRSIYDWLDETFELWGAAARGEDVPLSVADRWG
ncbi:MAG TPA: trehalose-6-phosphate synthase [Longimicrobiales bacterium]|nr:trehalose-6-phosphate synthase [Longimicrobiales bacterium]